MSETDTQATQAQDPAAAATSTEQEASSEASEQKQANVPEATQGNEATEVKAEATADSEEVGFLGGKYKTAKELEDAYKALKDKHDSEARANAELTRLLEESFIPSDTAKATQKDDVEGEDFSEDDPAPKSQPDDGTKRDVAVMKFVMAHPDADGTLMNEVLTKDPVVANINGYEAKLKYAYAQSKIISTSKAVEEARKQGAQQAQAKAAEKEVARVESAQKAAPTDEDAELRSQMANGTPAERDAARLKLIKKHLVNL